MSDREEEIYNVRQRGREEGMEGGRGRKRNGERWRRRERERELINSDSNYAAQMKSTF